MNNTNVRVDFRIMGDNYNTEEITKVLGVTPTITWNAGELINNTNKRHSYTAWVFSTGVEETLDINTQLKKIEQTLLPKLDKLHWLKNQYDLDFSLDIVIIIENESPPAIYFENSILNLVSNIEARIDIDTYIN